jgi:glycine cleavage system regulatory protein
VLKLRALGDLKSQKISAQDVTKVYFDLESELKAARAMEERLLNIIKSGKGEIKDLLAAEKELGVYRNKIEKVEGEIRYYNNLVSFSTLAITAAERDIRKAAFASQTEHVSMGIEHEDVEKARADAIKAIEDAKGRIIESNLKKFDGGQLAASITCEVAPDASGPLIDRLRQLGRIARLDIERKQTPVDGPVANAPAGLKVERKDTRFVISLYNLANIAPRQTTNMNVAVPVVEEAYRAIIETVRGKNGRIVTSSLNRQKPEQTTATISFEVPSADADATLAEIRRDREVMMLTVTENPDTNNVTAAKRGFSLQIFSIATVAPRETESLIIASRARVQETFRNVLNELRKADARILQSQLNEQDKNNIAGILDFEVARTKEIDVRQALGAAGELVSRTVNRSADTDQKVDSKIRLQVRLMSFDRLTPRETQSIQVASRDVAGAYHALAAAVAEVNGRVIRSELNVAEQNNVNGVLDFEVRREDREKVQKALEAAGTMFSRAVTRAADNVNTVESKVRLQVNLTDIDQLPPRERTKMVVEVGDVEGATAKLLSAVSAAGGRVVDTQQAKDADGQVRSQVVAEVPLAKAADVRGQIRALGKDRVNESSTNHQAPQGEVARARFEVTLANEDLIVGRDEGLWAAVRSALSTSVRGLLWSLKFIVVGLLMVGPWVFLIWGGWKVWKRLKRTPAVATA